MTKEGYFQCFNKLQQFPKNRGLVGGGGREAAQISSEQNHIHSYLIFKVDQGLKCHKLETANSTLFGMVTS